MPQIILLACASIFVLAERDADNTTIVQVRHSSGMVAIEPRERTRGDSAVGDAEPKREIGEPREEVSRADLHRNLEKAQARPMALQAKGNASSEMHPQLNQPPNGTMSSREATANSSLDASVKQALKDLIKSSRHIARAKSSPLIASDELANRSLSAASVVPMGTNSIGMSDSLTGTQDLLAGATSAEALVQGHVQLHPASGDQGDHGATMFVDKVPMAAKKVDNGEDIDPDDQEVVTSTSTVAPDAAIEELERRSTSVISVVFFTYMLLSLAAFAACTTFMTSAGSAEDCEETEKAKWRHILRHGSFDEMGS